MTASPTTLRRTAALMSVAASLALPAVGAAKDAPRSLYHPPRDNHSQTVSSPSPNNGPDGVAIAVTSGVVALTLGGVAYGTRRSSTQRRRILPMG
jgi:hypothetical protein